MELACQLGDSPGIGQNTPFLENISDGQLQVSSAVPADSLPSGAGEDSGCGSVVISPPPIMKGSSVVKRFGSAGRIHVVPMHSDWFSPYTVHRLERQVVPHFFSGKSADHVPEKYMECRNCIVAKYMENPDKYLSLDDCRGLITDVSHDDLARIVRFLDHWGIINYCAAPLNFDPRNETTLLCEDSNGDLCVPTDTLKSIDSLIKFDKPKCKLKASPDLASRSGEDPDFDNIIRENFSEARCNYCSHPTPAVYYQSQKEVDVLLCSDCYHDGRFVVGHSSLDFVKVNSMKGYTGLEGESWTDEETLLLLEGMQLYNKNWNKVAEHVGTKSKAQCILHFVRLPLDGSSLENVEVPGSGIQSNLQNGDDHGISHSKANGNSTGYKGQDSDFTSEFSFASCGNPVMALMNRAAESPVHSSSTSSDDFASFLDDELDEASDVPLDSEVEEELVEKEDDDDDFDSDLERIKRRKIECGKSSREQLIISANMEQPQASGALLGNDVCTHPGTIGGLCIRCGQKLDDEESGVAFGYIHKNLRLADGEIARLRDKDLKNLFRDKKLYLVLDLDHTLLNSSRLSDITEEERYLNVLKDDLPEFLKSSIHRLDHIHMMTKLRPSVHSFLKEASKLFEMYIYTMGERPYALEMAKLLDPQGIYFNSRVIAQGDSTKRHQKALDIVLGQESAVMILDDTEAVWGKHKENVIVMERYHFFASSCHQFGFHSKSLSELRSDESETDGALASVLKVLREIHSSFYDHEHTGSLVNRDVRQLLKAARKEVLKGCKVTFSHIFPSDFPAEEHWLWKLAEQLGAICCTELDPTITHVVALDAGTQKSRWAVKEEKFLVDPKWLEAANYLWRRMPEANYPVCQQPKQHR